MKVDHENWHCGELVNVGRLLEDIGGHIDRNHRSRPGRHATNEQHAAYRAKHREELREQNRRWRMEQRMIIRIRQHALRTLAQQYPDAVRDAVLDAIREHPGHPLLKKTVLHSNGDRTPVRSELDMLIMEVGR